MRTPALYTYPYDPASAVIRTQWLFAALVLIGVAAIGAVDASTLFSLTMVIGGGMLAVVTIALTLFRPALTPGGAWFYLIPALDIVVLALVHAELDSALSIAPLLAVIIPATWLGTSGKWWTIPLAAALGAFTVAIDATRLVANNAASLDPNFPVVVMTPIIAGVSALFGFQLVDEAAAASQAERVAQRTRDAIVDTVDVGLIVLDGTGTPIIINRALREHPVIRAEGPDPYAAVRAIPSFEADGKTRHSPDREPLVRAMTDEGLVDELFWARSHHDTSAHAFLANSRRLVDDQGQLEGTVMVFTDVTQYLEALQSRDRLISSVSHELRTPLTVMRGFLELAREEIATRSETVGHYFDVIERNLNREYAIVDQLILAPQSARASLSSRPCPTPLDELIAEAANIFTHEAGVKSISVSVERERTMVMIDPRFLRLIAEALIANAVRYTPPRGQINVRAETLSATPSSAERVRLTVSDSGAGMTEREIERVYDPFFRTEAAMRSGAPGMGLGLSVLKGILDSQEGTIDIRSRPGLGTVVTVELPAAILKKLTPAPSVSHTVSTRPLR